MPRSKRLFFALWPDDRVRSDLAHLQTLLLQARGNWVHPMDLHMTLQFLGPVPPNRERCILEAADAVQGAPFELKINRLEFWPKPRIVWAGPEHTPAELSGLVKHLGENLVECGFMQEKRAYRPHITVLRKTSPCMAMTLQEPVIWSVNGFVLVESRPGGEPPWYKVAESWGFFADPLGECPFTGFFSAEGAKKRFFFLRVAHLLSHRGSYNGSEAKKHWKTNREQTKLHNGNGKSCYSLR
ncbi:RNA 2',3'-cyclic phosphodiesterase [Thiolapillus sp.]|uniref:RNA 2',3'-cyclic phosphodiesterase n=2 Tax=Thiolapillus sp. TaxID=2017437 RepID=UPI0025EF76D0|nr:RNA 2',3'-cyclic phosphodiesterase [Thiolapillus sp.]